MEQRSTYDLQRRAFVLRERERKLRAARAGRVPYGLKNVPQTEAQEVAPAGPVRSVDLTNPLELWGFGFGADYAFSTAKRTVREGYRPRVGRPVRYADTVRVPYASDILDWVVGRNDGTTLLASERIDAYKSLLEAQPAPKNHARRLAVGYAHLAEPTPWPTDENGVPLMPDIRPKARATSCNPCPPVDTLTHGRSAATVAYQNAIDSMPTSSRYALFNGEPFDRFTGAFVTWEPGTVRSTGDWRDASTDTTRRIRYPVPTGELRT